MRLKGLIVEPSDWFHEETAVKPTTVIAPETPQTERKAYSTPTLTDFGSFAEITHGTIFVGVDAALYS